LKKVSNLVWIGRALFIPIGLAGDDQSIMRDVSEILEARIIEGIYDLIDEFEIWYDIYYSQYCRIFQGGNCGNSRSCQGSFTPARWQNDMSPTAAVGIGKLTHVPTTHSTNCSQKYARKDAKCERKSN
jgi:hypothetical protein